MGVQSQGLSHFSVLGAVAAAQEKHNKDGRNPSLNRIRIGRAEMGCAWFKSVATASLPSTFVLY